MSRMMNSRKGKESSGRRVPQRRGNDRRDFDHRSSDRRDSGRRDFRRDSGRSDFKRRDFGDRPEKTMTRVTCASCGKKCEVPFVPSSDKPVYCRDCFGRDDDRSSDRRSSSRPSSTGISERDLDIINEKLNKIMKALDIR